MEDDIKLSHSVRSYALLGFLSLGSGRLDLYEDKIVFSRLFSSDVIELSDLDYVEATNVAGFLPFGLEFGKKSGEVLCVYFPFIFTAYKNRKQWLTALERFVRFVS